MDTAVRAVALGLQSASKPEVAAKAVATGCKALAELMGAKNGRPIAHNQALVAETGGGALLQALSVFSADARVQAFVVTALTYVISSNPGTCAAVSGNGGVALLLTAMGNHTSSVGVQRRACNMALQLALYGGPEVCVALAQVGFRLSAEWMRRDSDARCVLQGGAMQAIVAALQAHGAQDASE